MPPRLLPLDPHDVAQGLGLPARDLLRAARRALTGPLAVLEPVGARMPGRLRNGLAEIAVRLGGRGGLDDVARQMQQPLFPADQTEGDAAAAARFARIAYFGLTRTLGKLDRSDLAVSETLAGYCFARSAAHAPAVASAAQRAAATGMDLIAHHAVGVVPGTPIGLDDDADTAIRLAVFAVMLWLLAERSPDGPGEADVLDLCVAVAGAQRAAVAGAGDDVGVVASLLDCHAAMI